MAIAFLISLFGALVSATIASGKNLSPIGYGLLGFFLPLIGIIVVLCAKAVPAPTEVPQQQ